MTDKLSIDPKTSALLIMDFQTAIVDGYATDSEALLNRTAGALDAARGAKMMVIYIVVGFRPGYPEIDPAGNFGGIRGSGKFGAEDPGAAIHPAVASKPGDIIVTKHRVSAFLGTDLDMILRSNGIRTMVLGGIATSGVVLSTLRHAADADYKLVVLKDCCADLDAEVHRVLLDKVFARQATVVSAAEFTQAI